MNGNTPIRAEGTNFYYTDVISDHAVADIDKLASAGKPFFLYVAFTAPHWPLQAPEADIAKYRERYLAGWDSIRSNRHERQIQLGLIDRSWPLSPRDSRMPVWEAVADKAWEANRMATYAAMVDRMDQGIGRILNRLKEKGIEQNTLVIFLADNGACAEILDPRWYDIPSRTRSGEPVKVGNSNHSVFAGPDDVWQSYGIPWANVSNTPFRLYKHFTHEGGISSPLIVSWPAGIQARGDISRQIGHVTDILPTFLEVAGARHLSTVNNEPTTPLEGESLMSLFQMKPRKRGPIFWEHECNRAVRLNEWKLVARHREAWQLYNLTTDRTEAHDLAASHPDQVKELSALYDTWAKRCQVVPPEELPNARRTKPASND